MGLCRCVCGFFAVLLAIPALLICAVCVPEVELAYIRFYETYAFPYPPLRMLMVILGQVPRIWEVGGPLGVGPVWNPRLVYAVDGYQVGVMPFPNPANLTSAYMMARVSHKEVRAVHHNPHTKRDEARFIGVETAKVPKGYFSEGVLPTLLQMHTDDPMRYAHRDLLSAVMPAIAQDPDFVPEFKAFPGISAEDMVGDILFHLKIPYCIVTNMVQDVFAFTFYRHAFGVELTKEELPLLKEWLGIPGKLFIGMASESGAKRASELAKVFEDKVEKSEFGQRLIAEAERRGFDGVERVRKTVFEFSFAGFGGDGPGGALATLKMLRLLTKDPEKMVPLFKNDPEAFILETIRTKGGGGAGMNPFVIEKTKTYTWNTGSVYTEEPGTYGATIALHANHDPKVFGGPQNDQQFAMDFRPGRENADRLLSFVGELREIRKCPNMTGCEAAPRSCLGTFLLQRIMKQIGLFYVQGLESQHRQEI